MYWIVKVRGTQYHALLSLKNNLHFIRLSISVKVVSWQMFFFYNTTSTFIQPLLLYYYILLFTGVRTHLQILKIANTSLTLLPSFQLPQLKTLNVSSNHLTFVAPETMANLSNVRDLDLSRNELATPPSSAWHSMHHLRTLNLAGNPISQYMNDSFLGLDKLEFLDVSDIPVVRYQVSIIQCRFFSSTRYLCDI